MAQDAAATALPDRLRAAGARPASGARRVLIAAGALFLAVFALYALTAQHDIAWQDQGEYVLRMVTGEQIHHMGLALSHPLHQWLGRISIGLLPFLEPPHAAAMVSALFGALTVTMVFGAVAGLTRNPWAATFAAVSLAVAHTFWRLSTYVDCYTISTMLLAIECGCLIGFARSRAPGWLLGMMFVNGLGLANHNLALLMLPVLGIVLLMGVFYWRVLSWGGFALAIGLWVVGSLPFTGLVFGRMLETGQVMGTIHSALFGDFESNVLHMGLPVTQTAISTGFMALSFPSLALPLAVLGMFKGQMAPLVRRALLAGLAIHLLFVLRYDVIDQYTFLGPAYTILMIFAGSGMAVLLARPRSRRRLTVAGLAAGLLLLTPLIYLQAPELARASGWVEPFERNRPYRDDYTYLFHPWRHHETSAGDMSRHAVELAGERAIIISPNQMAMYAIRYQLHREQRDGVELERTFHSSLARLADRHDRPVVLVPRDRDDPDDGVVLPWGRWVREGDLYLWDPDADEDD